MQYSKDIYTENPADPDTLANLGPLAPLAGTWYGDQGVDTHPVAEGTESEPFVETLTFLIRKTAVRSSSTVCVITLPSRSRANSPHFMIRWATFSMNPLPARFT